MKQETKTTTKREKPSKPKPAAPKLKTVTLVNGKKVKVTEKAERTLRALRFIK